MARRKTAKRVLLATAVALGVGVIPAMGSAEGFATRAPQKRVIQRAKLLDKYHDRFRWEEDEEDEEDEEIPFADASIYFELNDTDGDLGIHALIDGDAWDRLEIEDSNERRMLRIDVRGRLKRQGLTELFFESAEPSFDELDPEEFFARFPEGVYEIEGRTLEGEELESEVFLSHVIPAAPDGAMVNDEEAAEDCDADPLPAVSEPVVLSWDPVTEHHDELGKEGDVEVEKYEVVVEQEDLDLSLHVNLPPDATSFEVPSGIFALGEVKFEILVRAATGNQSAMESCFELE